MNSVKIIENSFYFPAPTLQHINALGASNYPASVVEVMHGLRKWAHFCTFGIGGGNINYTMTAEPLPNPVMRETVELTIRGKAAASIAIGSSTYPEAVAVPAVTGQVFELQTSSGRHTALAYFENVMGDVLRKCNGEQINVMLPLRVELLNALDRMTTMYTDPVDVNQLHFWHRDFVPGSAVQGCIDSTVSVTLAI